LTLMKNNISNESDRKKEEKERKQRTTKRGIEICEWWVVGSNQCYRAGSGTNVADLVTDNKLAGT
jgi:hypothetical protein